MKHSDIGFGGSSRLRDRRTRWLGVGVLAAASIAWFANTRAAQAAPKCVSFDGLRHCPVAGAVLELSSQGELTVHNQESQPTAGVSIAMPDVRSWEGEMTMALAAGVSKVFRADSTSDGVVTSRAQVKRSGKDLLFTSAFTGSVEQRAYRVDVLLDGVQLASVTDVPSGLDVAKSTSVTGWPEVSASRSYNYNSEFIIMPNGACQWAFRFDADAHPVTLPDGRKVMGNEIRMTEQVNPAGAYPYTTFDGLVFLGNFVSLDFASESVD